MIKKVAILFVVVMLSGCIWPGPGGGGGGGGGGPRFSSGLMH